LVAFQRQEAFVGSHSTRNIRLCSRLHTDIVSIREKTETYWAVHCLGSFDMEALLVNLPLYFPPRFPFDFFHSQNAVASQSAHDGQVTDTNVTSCEATLRRQQTERPGVAFASSAFCILLSPSIRSVYTLFQRFAPSRKRQARRTQMLQSETNPSQWVSSSLRRSRPPVSSSLSVLYHLGGRERRHPRTVE
jgi:hypothetical protein